MICRTVVLLALVPALVASPGFAFEGWMGEGELRSTFAGKAVQGHYASGKAFTEAYRADGGIEYSEAGLVFGGHWSLQAGSFCTIYQGDATGGCYRVRQVSANCYEFYFVSRTEQQAAQQQFGQPAWTARAAVADRDPTCSEKPTV